MNKETPEWIKATDLPPHISLIWHADHFILRCGTCGSQSRYGLPDTPAWLRRIAHAFKDQHQHRVSDSTASGELKPCPFCGWQQTTVLPWAGGENYFVVHCQRCKAEGPPAFPLEAAREMWNGRAGESVQPGNVDRKR